ncbi:MAG: peptidylprolyl isomerase [Thermodesulfobacteriota bacterium]
MSPLFKRFFIMALITLVVPTGLPAQDKEILAKVGTRKITQSDLNRLISFHEPEQQKMIEKNPQVKEALLWQMIRSMVVADSARKKSFDKKPEVRAQQEIMINNFLAAMYLQKEVVEKVTVNEEKARTYYKDNLDAFRTPETIRARHILIKTDPEAKEEDKKKTKEKAEGVLKKLKEGADFAKLATEFSDDPGTKDKGGDLDFFPKGSMVPAFEEAAFALKPGEISGLVETEYGYHIIKLEEKKEAFLEPYEKIKETVKEKALQDLKKEAVTNFVEKAMKEARVEVFSEKLAKPQK